MDTDKAPTETRCRFINITAVCDRTNCSPATIWRRVQAGDFPAPVEVGANRKAWVEADIDVWMRDRIAARDARIASGAKPERKPQHAGIGRGGAKKTQPRDRAADDE